MYSAAYVSSTFRGSGAAQTIGRSPCPSALSNEKRSPSSAAMKGWRRQRSAPAREEVDSRPLQLAGARSRQHECQAALFFDQGMNQTQERRYLLDFIDDNSRPLLGMRVCAREAARGLPRTAGRPPDRADRCTGRRCIVGGSMSICRCLGVQRGNSFVLAARKIYLSIP